MVYRDNEKKRATRVFKDAVRNLLTEFVKEHDDTGEISRAVFTQLDEEVIEGHRPLWPSPGR